MFSIRIRIWHKLFFSILLVILLILLVNMAVTRYSFQQGFGQYIEDVRLKRLNSVERTLSGLYRQYGHWDFLKNKPLLWQQLLLEHELASPPQRNAEQPEHRREEPSARLGSARVYSERRHHAAVLPPHLRGRIGLQDSAQTPIFGPPASKNDRKLPIKLDGEVIGYLSMRRLKGMRTGIEQRFEHDQVKNLLLTGILSFVIAVIVSLLLARAFNKPITRLTGIARQLTSGQFDSRVEKISRDELGDLATDLNTLAETLDQNQQSRRQWIADISHELRTPLTILKGELEAMEDNVRELNSESIQSLSLEVKHLQRLVDDLYQLSLSDQGSLTYEKVAVNPFLLLQNVAEGYELPMEQKNITLSVACDEPCPMVLADPQRLTQLFTNLLENSLRYTHEGGRVKIQCKKAASLTICFEDSEPGISPELIPRLFERLFRVDNSRNRDSGGSGLGLSIAQSIAEAHEGKLTAEPSSLGGLKITLELPISSG